MNALSLFNDWLRNDCYGASSEMFAPNVDVRELKDSYIVEMDLPGRSEKDVSIELNDKVLSISSIKNATEDDSERTEDNDPVYLLKERHVAEFRRSFSMPKDIDEEKISAEFKNGVLTVTIPRRPESQPRRIAINAVSAA